MIELVITLRFLLSNCLWRTHTDPGSAVFAPEEQDVYSAPPLILMRSARSAMSNCRCMAHLRRASRQELSPYKHTAPPEQRSESQACQSVNSTSKTSCWQTWD
jgi:hypothetical protein